MSDVVERITAKALRRCWDEHTVDIIGELRNAVRRVTGIGNEPYLEDFGTDIAYLTEQTIGTIWGGLMGEFEDMCLSLTLEGIEEVCCEAGLDVGRREGLLVITLPNHTYSFFTQEDSAYGGPCSRHLMKTGGLECMMTGEEFVRFITVFDTLVPEMEEFLKANLQDARNFVKALEIMTASVRSVISPYVRMVEDRFWIAVAECDPEKTSGNVSLNFGTQNMAHFRQMWMDLDYNELIASPAKWIAIGCRSFDDPDIARQYGCIQFWNDEEQV